MRGTSGEQDATGALLDTCEKLLASVRGRCDEARVFVSAEDSALTRFARSRIHQNCHERQLELQLVVNRGGRIGRAGANQDGPEALGRLAATALEAASVAPPDPDWPGVGRPEPAAAGDAWSTATAEATAAERGELAAAVCRSVPAPGLAYGGLLCSAVHQAAATTAGLRSAQRRTLAEVRVTVHAPAGAGYAARATGDLRDLDPLAVAGEALAVASLPGEPAPVPVGEHRVVLAPYAVGRLLEFLSFLGFAAARHREGRSFMSLGERITGELVTIADDGASPEGIPVAFDCEGTPKRRVELIREGMAVGLVHDRASAAKEGVPSTGHAVPAAVGEEAYAANLSMSAGAAGLEELLAPIEDGLLVTRAHYVSILDPLRAVVTGVTRDGTVAVRGGRLAGPAQDVRFQAGLLDLLDGLEAVGSERRTLLQTIHGYVTVPHVRVRALPVIGAAH